MKKAILLVTSMMILVFSAAFVYADIYYVDPLNGNDNTARVNDINYPYRHLSYNIFAVKAGDTVILRGGSYVDDYFWPANTFSKYAPITIKAYPGETPLITGTGYGGSGTSFFIGWAQNKGYVIIDGLHFENISGGNPPIQVVNYSNGVIVKNCIFKNISCWANVILDTASYCVIENNAFDTLGSPGDKGSADHVSLRGSDHCLIQNNYLVRGGHSAIGMGYYKFSDGTITISKYNVIRNNLIEQHWGAGIGTGQQSQHNVIEGNKVYYVGEEVTTYPKDGLQMNSLMNIIRKNVVAYTSPAPYQDNGMVMQGYPFEGFSQDSKYNRVYNNVIYKSGSVGLQVYQTAGGNITGNRFLNNILYYNKVGGVGSYYGLNSIALDTYWSDDNNKWLNLTNNNYFYNNLILGANESGDLPGMPVIYNARRLSTTTYPYLEEWEKSLAQVQIEYPEFFWGNIEDNPMFFDVGNNDFTLRADSPAIDKGAHLTKTVSAGSNTMIVPVEDALFFSDGFGIAEADMIKIGANNPVGITSVDYDNNKITVASAITFNFGDNVDLPYLGSAPDMGAFEHNPSAGEFVKRFDRINTWYIFSLPAEPVDGSIDKVLEGLIVVNPNGINLSTFDNFTDASVSYPICDVLAGDPNPGKWSGKAFYVLLNNAATLSFAGIERTNDFSCNLNSGWNLIGYPLNHNMPVADVRFKLGTEEKSFTDALNAGWIDSFQRFDSENNRLVNVGTSSTAEESELMPWQGYWIMSAKGNLVMTIPVSSSGTGIMGGTPITTVTVKKGNKKSK